MIPHLSNRSLKVLIYLIGALVFALISFPNHCAFRTYALDLGLYTQFAWNYLHGVPSTLEMIGEYKLPLADHFDLYLWLFAPVVGLFQTWGLLIIQWLAVIAGMIWTGKTSSNARVQILLILFFIALWPVTQALALDYHSNVVASMLWLLWWVLMRKEKTIAATIVLCFIWIGKENMPLFMSFSAAGYAFLFPHQRKVAFIQSIASFLAFVAILFVIMPYFSNGTSVSNLGKYTIVTSFIADPSLVSFKPLISHIFSSKSNGVLPEGDVKVEFWLFLALSGGWLLVRKPAYLLMIVPVVLQKMWHDNELFGGTIAHYSIELVPVLVVAGADFFERYYPRKWMPVVALLFPTFFVCIKAMDNPVNNSNQANARFYKSTHYHRPGQSETHAYLSTLSQDLSISAMAPIVPHLALRSNIFQFPLKTSHSDVAILMKNEQIFPFLSSDERDAHIQKLKTDSAWEVDHENDLIIAFRHK
ncbi:MAG: hypothetical protein RL226_84 [Bacteroidota bacterium]